MSSFEQGYQYFVKNASQYFGTNQGTEYVKKVQTEIDRTIDEMSKTVTQRTHANNAATKGFVAEDWHAGTFNADVAAKNGNLKSTYAFVDKTNDPRVDIFTNHKGASNGWQSKYYKTAGKTAKELSHPKYDDVGKVAPSDQINHDGIKSAAQREAMRNQEIRPNVSRSYAHTAENAKAVIEETGYSSKELSDADALRIVKEMKNGSFDPKKYGLVTENFIKMEYVMQQALKAGVTAAAISSILKIGPEIYKVMMDLIDKGQIDKGQLKDVGFISLTAPVEGFLRGSVSAAITATFTSGLAGETLKAIDPTIISTATVIVMNAMHNSIGVATGRMSKAEFADACGRDLVVSSFAVLTGTLSQSLIQIPVLGFLLGSFVGSVIGGFAYEAGKSICLSFCVESGFTFFGLVEQDYRLPKDVIEQIGVDVFNYEKMTYRKIHTKTVQFKTITYKKVKVNKIDTMPLRRGVIGVTKISYI